MQLQLLGHSLKCRADGSKCCTAGSSLAWRLPLTDNASGQRLVSRRPRCIAVPSTVRDADVCLGKAQKVWRRPAEAGAYVRCNQACMYA